MVNGRTAPRSVICAQRTRRPAGRCHGPTERLPATIAREEPPARRRQSEVPDPTLDRIPNLGSHILALIRRRLPLDWAERYNTTPVLIETFVETPRYTGAVYRASGWIHVGATKRRGRYDRDKLYDKPRKDIWLRPPRSTGTFPSPDPHEGTLVFHRFVSHHDVIRPERIHNRSCSSSILKLSGQNHQMLLGSRCMLGRHAVATCEHTIADPTSSGTATPGKTHGRERSRTIDARLRRSRWRARQPPFRPLFPPPENR